ncbi:MAG: hypothetical protein GX043_07350 [Desulfovibrionales bacterium]|nr:hypothetical protein [Desulfovibrionales bacterium]
MVMAQLDLAKAEAANAAELLRHHETLIKSGGKNYGCRVVELASQVEAYNLPEREKKIEAQQAVVRTTSGCSDFYIEMRRRAFGLKRMVPRAGIEPARI